jgi:hypothetical protein
MKFTQDVLPIPLQPLGECGLSYPIEVVDGPLQLVERQLRGLSVSPGFPRTVPNTFLARVHSLPPSLESRVRNVGARDAPP